MRAFIFIYVHIDICTIYIIEVLSSNLRHNAHFRDIGRRFRHPLTPFLTPLAPRGPRDREPLLLGKCSRMPRNLLPSRPPPILLFHPLLQAQNIASPKMASYDLRAGFAKQGCLCSIITWTSSTTNMDTLPTSCFPLPCCSSSIGDTSSHTTFFLFPESTQRSSSTFTPLVPFPDRSSALHCRPHLRRRVAVAITLQRSPSLPLCSRSQLVWLRREHACPG